MTRRRERNGEQQRFLAASSRLLADTEAAATTSGTGGSHTMSTAYTKWVRLSGAWMSGFRISLPAERSQFGTGVRYERY
jgi:hypothetical protein